MPGEAQKVDRIMQAFAAALYRDAPGPFADADAQAAERLPLLIKQHLVRPAEAVARAERPV